MQITIEAGIEKGVSDPIRPYTTGLHTPLRLHARTRDSCILWKINGRAYIFLVSQSTYGAWRQFRAAFVCKMSSRAGSVSPFLSHAGPDKRTEKAQAKHCAGRCIRKWPNCRKKNPNSSSATSPLARPARLGCCN